MRCAVVGTVALGAVVIGLTAPAHAASNGRAAAVNRHLAAIADDPIQLRQFFVELPKGADLHQHLAGTVYAEKLMHMAASQGQCISTVTYVVSPPPCTEGQVPAASLPNNVALQGKVVAAWSMRLFIPSLTESGHDHFFNAFALFDGAMPAGVAQGSGLASVLDQAARDHVLRIETKVTPNSTGASALASAITTQAPESVLNPASFPQALAIVHAAGLDATVSGATHQTDQILAQSRSELGCGTAQANPGCDVELGFVAQVARNAPPARVFAGLATGFATAARDSRWVAVDLVSPEDGVTALADYDLHMEMIRYLRTVYPGVFVDVHAGELIPGLVPPADLTSHIRKAVLVAGTDRVGHGSGIRGEDDAAGLLKIMRDRKIAVEVALTSNEQILGLNDKTSQFTVYWAAGVPIVLATDDAGIERTDLSEQYQKAFTWFDLSYQDLKKLSYQSADSSFLTSDEHVRLRAKLDAAFGAFERKWSTAKAT